MDIKNCKFKDNKRIASITSENSNTQNKKILSPVVKGNIRMKTKTIHSARISQTCLYWVRKENITTFHRNDFRKWCFKVLAWLYEYWIFLHNC